MQQRTGSTSPRTASQLRDVEKAKRRDDPASLTRKGQLHVAVIGVDRYEHCGTLSNAVSDAKGALAAFTALGFQPRAVLLDEQATAEAMERMVKKDLRGLGKEDSLVVFFAGHGYTEEIDYGDGSRARFGYIVPVDGTPKREGSCIRLRTWLDELTTLAVRHIFVILDSCQSGIALEPMQIWNATAPTHNFQGSPIKQLHHRRSRHIITSALDSEYASDRGPKEGHSLFTGYLIDALSGEASYGADYTTSSEVAGFVKKRVIAYSKSRQTPTLGVLGLHDFGELIIDLPTAPRPSPTVPTPPSPVVESAGQPNAPRPSAPPAPAGSGSVVEHSRGAPTPKRGPGKKLPATTPTATTPAANKTSPSPFDAKPPTANARPSSTTAKPTAGNPSSPFDARPPAANAKPAPGKPASPFDAKPPSAATKPTSSSPAPSPFDAKPSPASKPKSNPPSSSPFDAKPPAPRVYQPAAPEPSHPAAASCIWHPDELRPNAGQVPTDFAAALDRHARQRKSSVLSLSFLAGVPHDALAAFATWSAQRGQLTMVTAATRLDEIVRELLSQLPWFRCLPAARSRFATAAVRAIDAIGAAFDGRSPAQRTAWIAEVAGSSGAVRVAGWLLATLRDSRDSIELAKAPLQGTALLEALGELSCPISICLHHEAPTEAWLHDALEAAKLLTLRLPGHAVAVTAPTTLAARIRDAREATEAISLAKQGYVSLPELKSLRAAAAADLPRSPAKLAATDAAALEQRLWDRLAKDPRTSEHFERHVAAPIHERHRQVEVLFAARAQRLLIELDGWHHLRDPLAYRNARLKDLWLLRAGFFPLRFLAEDVERRLDAVLDEIARGLAGRRVNEFSH